MSKKERGEWLLTHAGKSFRLRSIRRHVRLVKSRVGAEVFCGLWRRGVDVEHADFPAFFDKTSREREPDS